MKPEIKITKCYLVECVINNTKTYYGSEYVFGNREYAKEVADDLKEAAEYWLQEHKDEIKEQITGAWETKMVRGTLVPCCSVCGESSGTCYEYNYCPNCGAKMEVEK